jgi:hypothetical protein
MSFDEMSFYKMSFLSNVFCEISFGQLSVTKYLMIKCLSDKMSFDEMSFWRNVFLAKCLLTKCPTWIFPELRERSECDLAHNTSSNFQSIRDCNDPVKLKYSKSPILRSLWDRHILIPITN